MKRAVIALSGLAAVALVVTGAGSSAPTSQLSNVSYIVVIYEEDHSFDNLYGGSEGLNGSANATAAEKTQVSQSGTPFTCLKQLDVNLTSPPLAATCTDSTTGTTFTSAFPKPRQRYPQWAGPPRWLHA